MGIAPPASIQARISQIESQFNPQALSSSETSAAFESVLAAATGGAKSPMSLDELLGTLQTTSGGALSAYGAISGAVGGNDVVENAKQYLGVPYKWGGTNPDAGLDCSGFVQLVHKNLGIDLPRVSRDQAQVGTEVASLAEAVPGDLVTFGSPVDHIGIYVGDGKMIHAPRTGDVVKIAPITRDIATIRRVIPQGGTPLNGAGSLDGLVSPYRLGGGSPAGSGATSGAQAKAQPYLSAFAAAGARHGVAPALLAAVAQTESGFNPSAKSPAGASGLMQFMPATAKDMGIDPQNPTQAIDGAARYLRQQLDSFGSVDLALAAYNAGPGAVRRFGGIPPYSETQSYVRKVNSAMTQTNSWFGGRK